MRIGLEIQAFIAAARALLHALDQKDQRVLTKEEHDELQRCVKGIDEKLAQVVLRLCDTGQDHPNLAA